MRRERIEKFQNPIVWVGMLAIMLGLAAKQVLVTKGAGIYIDSGYFLSHLKSAPSIVWVYWSLIFIFAICFCAGAFLEWFKRR
ncbi:hypothetical protein [Novosphingobium kaempferiae]|uniref:hypothetical protein n=1 Tax=Novosphingobium kaempferiae TaxID=2896849 RepID=UPI001E3EF152|nr:hypothetical protein [Novosphingobium kaempferiae]